MSNFRLLPRALLTLFCVALPAVSNAQLIEEIVVTAAKRAQTLQEIPIAVSVTSGETIEKAGIQDINGLQSVVPTLRVTQLQSSANTNFAIRGFGNGTNNVGIEPSVGVFIDGVYRSRAGAAISDLPRLERVEVLSGPQSTLFGKNASAGVISVITPKPSGETGGYVSAGLSNFGGVNVKGLFESAISDNVTFDISGSVNQRDGYFGNSFLDIDQNERDRWGVRGQLHWAVSDTTEVRIIADHDEIDEVCCGTTNLQSGGTALIVGALGGQLVPNEPFSRNAFLDINPFNEVENEGISMQIDVDMGNTTLTSITSFREGSNFNDVDIDYTSSQLVSSGQNMTDIETFTQEIRLTSSGDGDVDWMIGGFYFDEDVDFQSDVIWGNAFRPYVETLAAVVTGAPFSFAPLEGLIGLPVGTFYAPGTGVVDQITQANEAFSIFGTVDWHISDSLTATVGLNYTEDEKEVTVGGINTNPGGAFLAGGPLEFNPPTIPLPNGIEDNSTNDDEVTYTIRLAYDISDSVNIYANHATGFKATSWNLSRDSAPVAADFQAIAASGVSPLDLGRGPGTRFAGPEDSTVYELGLKARFDRASLNMAIFDQTIEGFQSAIFTGTGFVLANAGEQSTKGLEFDLNYFATDALKLTFAGIFLDPVYDSFVGGNTENGPTDLSGQAPAGIHEVSLSLSATYNFRLGNNDAFLRGDFQYEDDIKVVENVPASVASREVKLLNLSAGMSTESGLDYNLWMRNVTDEDYLLSAFPTPAQGGSFNGYPNEPRTYGVSIKKSF